MPIVDAYQRSVVAAGIIVSALVLGGPAAAFDGSATTPDQDPVSAFRTGTKAYRSGDKETALEALRQAARQGHVGAQWRIGRMYAEGDGVAEDDLKAFKYFNALASAHGYENPAGPNAHYTSNAIVALGAYYLTGIRDTNVKPDLDHARWLFNYAASYFSNTDAQYRLALMFLEGTGGERDPMQGARWLKRAAERDHLRSQATLGDLLFHGDVLPMRRPVAGLMWLTIARERAGAADRDWIAEKQELAFSAASEEQRRAAVDFADRWIVAATPSERRVVATLAERWLSASAAD